MTTRTITLFDRRPVTIEEDNWPVIAEASECDNADKRAQLPSADPDCDCPAQGDRTWTIKIRQERQEAVSPSRPHLTPRAIVYAAYTTSWVRSGDRSQRGGYLVDEADPAVADEAIIRAVRETVIRLGIHSGAVTWQRLGQEVLSALAPELL